MVLPVKVGHGIVKKCAFIFSQTSKYSILSTSYNRKTLVNNNRSKFSPIKERPNSIMSRKYSQLPSTDFKDLDSARIEFFLELQNTFKNQSMSPKVKSKRLKILLLQLISVLPNSEFSNTQLPFINSIINYIDYSPSPLDNFSPDEMLALLRSVLGGMTLQDVKYIDFFPRFYNSLRGCEEYSKDAELRLQLFEIFINYVLLSTKRSNVGKIIDAFIKEEAEIHNTEPNVQVIEIMIDAFKTIKPDTETVLLLFELCPDLSYVNPDVSELPLIDQLLSTFFKASDEEISESFEDNFVSDRLVQLLDILEKKLNEPLNTYVEILYFSIENNFDDVSKNILTKLEKLTNGFTNTEFENSFQSDILYALVNASLKFNKAENATNLIKILNKKGETEYTGDDWKSQLQYAAYNIDESKPAIELVREFNTRLNSLNSELEFTDMDSLNLVTESLCWSNKSLKYILEFKLDFENEFEIQFDAKTLSLILESLIKDPSNVSKIQNASKLFLNNKDLVDWENDYEGFYMISLFKLTSVIWQCKEISWEEKFDVYKNVKRYEYLFDKNSIYEMIKAAIQLDEAIYGIRILLDQIPELKKGENNKFKVSHYQQIFDLVYEYLVNQGKDKELNEKVYRYLSDYFQIPYDYYPGFVKMFIDLGNTDMALKVFADMKKLSKESKLPPPNEEFYIYLLKSFSKFQDDESIFKLHLAIKMDLSINLDIKLLNALMESYAAIEDPFKTRDIYNLSFSLPKEHGLNNESAYWMLKSLKYATLHHVNDFYNGLSTYEIIPDKYLFSELLVANCYFEQYLTAFETLKLAEKNGDLHLIDEYTLKTLHNNCLHDGIRNKFTKYCETTFPKQWDNLLKSGELEINKEEYPDLLASPYESPKITVKSLSEKSD